MADLTASGTPATELGRVQSSYMAQTRRRRLMSAILLAVFAAIMVGGFQIANDRNAGGFVEGIPAILDFPTDVVSEAWEKRAELPGLLVRYLPALVETLNIAAVATLLGGIGGALLSLLGTRGLAPFPRLIPVFRRITDVMRAIPEIVLALVLIFLLGVGPVPAMLAIAFHTAGAIGKLFSEVNENASLKPIEGLSSVGAGWVQRMWLGLVPQVAPNWLSYALLRFEINIRASAILGFVGAGGLGYELKNSMTWGQGKFDEAAAVFLLLFVTIVIVDQVSSRYRDRLTRGAAL